MSTPPAGPHHWPNGDLGGGVIPSLLAVSSWIASNTSLSWASLRSLMARWSCSWDSWGSLGDHLPTQDLCLSTREMSAPQGHILPYLCTCRWAVTYLNGSCHAKPWLQWKDTLQPSFRSQIGMQGPFHYPKVIAPSGCTWPDLCTIWPYPPPEKSWVGMECNHLRWQPGCKCSSHFQVHCLKSDLLPPRQLLWMQWTTELGKTSVYVGWR